MLRLKKITKFSVGDHVWVSKYKNIFVKAHQPIWSEEVFLIKRDIG